MLKLEHKQKVASVRKNMRNKKSDKEVLRKLDEEYVQKCLSETELMNERHEKVMETLKAELEINMKELQDIQVQREHECCMVWYVGTCPGHPEKKDVFIEHICTGIM